MTNAQTDGENAGQIIRRRGGEIVEGMGKKSRGKRALRKKMLIIDDRSHYMYENKQKDDNFPDENGDILCKRHDILYKGILILGN